MSATNTTTVAILNLCTVEKYFSQFEVECWDVTETTKIDSILVAGKWDSSTSKWLQTDAAYFYGLTMGTVYHFRARVLSSGGGLPSSWSAFTPETAGDSTAPTITIASVSNNATASGVNFDLTITTSDTDIHHYEVTCKFTLIGAGAPSAPAASDLPSEPKYFSNGSGHVLFTKTFADFQQCFLWIRAVDTSGNASAWLTVGGWGFITDGSGDAQGQNLLDNPSFEYVANAGSEDIVVQGWQDGGNNLCTTAQDNVNYTTGHNSLYFHQVENTVVPASTTLFCTYQHTRMVPVKPGQTYVLRLKARYDRGGAAPVAGLTNHIKGSIDWYDGTVTLISGIDTNHLLDADNGTGWQTLTGTSVAPALATTALIRVWNYVVNSTGSPKTLSASFPLDARFDAVEFIKAADSTTDEVVKRGSVPPTFSGSISYTNTTTSVSWSWALTMLRTDTGLTSQSITGGPFGTTGLTTSTTYYWYPYFDENTVSLQMVTGGSGSTGWAQTASSRTLSQQQTRSDRVPLSTSPLAAATTSSGTGSGGGGGDGTCLRKGTFVKEKLRGIVRVDTIKKDEYLWSENDTWIRVIEDAECKPTDAFINNDFTCGQVLDVTPTHSWTLRDRSSKKAAEINLLDEFICSTGVTSVVALKLLKIQDDKVVIKCEFPHVFWAASILDVPWVLTHNVTPSFL